MSGDPTTQGRGPATSLPVRGQDLMSLDYSFTNGYFMTPGGTNVMPNTTGWEMESKGETLCSYVLTDSKDDSKILASISRPVRQA